MEGSTFLCKSSSSANYKVVFASATVDDKNSDGDEWDSPEDSGCINCLLGCCPPDVYADSGSTVAGLSVPKTIEADDTTPTWNLQLGTAAEAQLINGQISVKLMDEDAGVLTDDDIGTCSATIQASDIQARQITLTRAGGTCSGGVNTLVIQFQSL
jgi:hypothetical protein